MNADYDKLADVGFPKMVFNPRIGIPYTSLVGRNVIIYDIETNETYKEGVVIEVTLIEDRVTQEYIYRQVIICEDKEIVTFHGDLLVNRKGKSLAYRLKIVDGDGIDVQTAKEKKLDTVAESVYNLLAFKMNCKEIEKVLDKVRRINSERANGK